MSAAVTPPPGKSGAPSGPTGERGLHAHKPGEGYATRLGMMVVIMAYVFFACHHWYYNWGSLRDLANSVFSTLHLGFMTGWTYERMAARVIGGGGTFLLAVTGFLVAYYFIYAKRSTAEFLIKTDGELAKVTWPKITPWFKSDTQVWGATYVVLIVIVALTLYVFSVDGVMQVVYNWLFLARGA